MDALFEGYSREQIIVSYGIILFLAVCFIWRWLKRSNLFKIVGIGAVVLLFFVGGSIINVSALPGDILSKLNEAKAKLSEMGLQEEMYVKADGGSVYVEVGDNWYNLDDVAIIGDFTKTNTINYNGQDIYLGNSGVYNTIKVLQDVGLLKKGD